MATVADGAEEAAEERATDKLKSQINHEVPPNPPWLRFRILGAQISVADSALRSSFSAAYVTLSEPFIIHLFSLM